MAKYTVKMGCGHEETVELFGKDTERHKKIAYFEEQGLCKKCYAEKCRKENPLTFNCFPLPEINTENGEIRVLVWFSGDTMPNKEKIKSLGGYRWNDMPLLTPAAGDMAWNKTVDQCDLGIETEKAKEIGAMLNAKETEMSMRNLLRAQQQCIQWYKNKIK